MKRDWVNVLTSAGMSEKKAATIAGNMDKAIAIDDDRIKRHTKKKLRKEAKVDVTEIIDTYKKEE